MPSICDKITSNLCVVAYQCAAGIDGDGAVGVRFYLGTHLPGWLVDAPFALFISHRRPRARRRLPAARHPWALDSGAFSELQQYGEWRTTAAEYARAVRLYAQEIGNLAWAAPMDWMCEPVAIAGGQVGLSGSPGPICQSSSTNDARSRTSSACGILARICHGSSCSRAGRSPTTSAVWICTPRLA